MGNEAWCKRCGKFVIPRIYRWESSIAIIEDPLCPHCGDFCHRAVSRIVEYKPLHPLYHSSKKQDEQ